MCLIFRVLFQSFLNTISLLKDFVVFTNLIICIAFRVLDCVSSSSDSFLRSIRTFVSFFRINF